MTPTVIMMQLNGVPLAFTKQEIAVAARRARKIIERDAGAMQGDCIGIADVLRMTGLCRASVYAGITRGTFPRQLVATHGRRRRALWRVSDVSGWLRARTENNDSPTENVTHG